MSRACHIHRRNNTVAGTWKIVLLLLPCEVGAQAKDPVPEVMKEVFGLEFIPADIDEQQDKENIPKTNRLPIQGGVMSHVLLPVPCINSLCKFSVPRTRQ